ncbi:unnamed protein product [Dicrocoelium dendriticum]|nr:unnamed protein product [Dicrocoelium dendriticum]
MLGSIQKDTCLLNICFNCSENNYFTGELTTTSKSNNAMNHFSFHACLSFCSKESRALCNNKGKKLVCSGHYIVNGNMKEELNGRVENKVFESVEPFSKSRGFGDLSCKPVECRQHDRIAADVQDFSSLIKVKQNVKTKESSTSPMHSPTRSCHTENWLLQLDGTDDNFQHSSLNTHCSKIQAFGHDTPMLHDTERNLIKEDDCAPFRSLNINNKINSLWNSKLDSSNLSSVSGQSTSKYPSGISYSGLGDCAKRISKSKPMHEEFENK